MGIPDGSLRGLPKGGERARPRLTLLSKVRGWNTGTSAAFSVQPTYRDIIIVCHGQDNNNSRSCATTGFTYTMLTDGYWATPGQFSLWLGRPTRGVYSGFGNTVVCATGNYPHILAFLYRLEHPELLRGGIVALNTGQQFSVANSWTVAQPTSVPRRGNIAIAGIRGDLGSAVGVEGGPTAPWEMDFTGMGGLCVQELTDSGLLPVGNATFTMHTGETQEAVGGMVIID